MKYGNMAWLFQIPQKQAIGWGVQGFKPPVASPVMPKPQQKSVVSEALSVWAPQLQQQPALQGTISKALFPVEQVKKVATDQKVEAERNKITENGFSQREMDFVQKAKASWMSKDDVMMYIQDKRKEMMPKKTFWENVKDVWEGIADFAWWIPKAIASSWVLDKTMEKVAWSDVWLFLPAMQWQGITTQQALQSLTKALVGEEELKRYQQEQWGKSFSEFSKWSQVWGDPESQLAKATSNTLNVLEAVWWVPALIKAWWKAVVKWQAGKKMWKILDVVRETENIGEKRAALSAWRIAKEPWALKKWWSWTKEVVQPSQRSVDAAEQIAKDIPNISKQPEVLYKQVSDKVSEIWNSLEWELKQIKVWSLTSKNSELQKSLSRLADEMWDLSKWSAKEIKKLAESIKNSSTADDVWKNAQKLDDMIPESIRKWVNLSWKDQIIYNIWRQARGWVNDHLDDIATMIRNVSVKDKFKKMSNYYHAMSQIKKKIWVLTKPQKWFKQKVSEAVNLKNLVIAGVTWKVLWSMD